MIGTTLWGMVTKTPTCTVYLDLGQDFSSQEILFGGERRANRIRCVPVDLAVLSWRRGIPKLAPRIFICAADFNQDRT